MFKDKIILFVIIFTYSLIAVFSVMNYGNSMFLGSFEKYDNDDVKYIRSGIILAEKGILTYEKATENTVYIMPGLSYTLALFFKLFGLQDGIFYFRIFQVLLQATSLYLIFLITRRAFNSKVALLTCAINALYLPEIFSVNLILMECIFKFLLIWLCYVGIIAVEKKSVKYYLLAGILWAAACYFRPTIALLPIVVLALWLKRKYKVIEMLKFGLITLSVFVLLLSPWWIRNYNLYQKFIPFTLSSGNPFLQGTYINYDQSKDSIGYNTSENFIVRNEQEKVIGYERLRKFGSKYPLKYIYWYTIGKSIYFWGSPFYWRDIFSIKLLYVQMYHVTVLVAAFLGLCKIKMQNITTNMMFYIIIYFNLIYLPFYTFSRYSYPLMTFVIAYASFGITYICSKGNRREVGQ